MKALGLSMGISVWLIGAVGFGVPSYAERCKPKEGAGDIIVMSIGSLFWPAIAVGRLGVATWNPRYGLYSLGCAKTDADKHP